MGEKMEHSKPVYKNQPKRYDQYHKTGETQDGEPLYRKERKLLENNPVAHCGICGKRLCSRFMNFCPTRGAYEAMIAAAKLWRTLWTPIARECVIENLGAVKRAKI